MINILCTIMQQNIVFYIAYRWLRATFGTSKRPHASNSGDRSLKPSREWGLPIQATACAKTIYVASLVAVACIFAYMGFGLHGSAWTKKQLLSGEAASERFFNCISSACCLNIPFVDHSCTGYVTNGPFLLLSVTAVALTAVSVCMITSMWKTWAFDSKCPQCRVISLWNLHRASVTIDASPLGRFSCKFFLIDVPC